MVKANISSLVTFLMNLFLYSMNYKCKSYQKLFRKK